MYQNIPPHFNIKIMKKYLLIIAIGMLLLTSKAQMTAYFNYGLFNVPNSSPFLETYLTVIGKSVKHIAVSGGFQASVNIKVNIYQGLKTIKDNNYNLRSPIDKDSIHLSTFIDNQRYSLPNGIYDLEIILTDNNSDSKQSFTYKEKFEINFSNKELASSSIEILDSYSKTVNVSSISKSGFDLIPYNVNYFPENQNKLIFYFESYNTDTVLGKNKNFLYTYYIQRKEDNFKPENTSGFKKQITAKVNPLLAQIDIAKLESGNYYLIIEIRDQNNILKLEKKWFFQRSSSFIKPITFKENRSSYEFFGNFNHADSIKMFVESLYPISSSNEREWAINQTLKKDPEMMKKFIVDFWQKRAGDTLDPLAEWIKYYKQVVEVNKLFKCGKQGGYYTDRGRVFLQYGKPNQRSQQNSESYSYPYEIWQYYRIQDGATGQFYTNKKFVFVNKNIADDCYKLIHSDMRGEIYNDRWQYEVSKRNNTSGNMDNTSPNSIYGSSADELYKNPK